MKNIYEEIKKQSNSKSMKKEYERGEYFRIFDSVFNRFSNKNFSNSIVITKNERLEDFLFFGEETIYVKRENLDVRTALEYFISQKNELSSGYYHDLEMIEEEYQENNEDFEKILSEKGISLQKLKKEHEEYEKYSETLNKKINALKTLVFFTSIPIVLTSIVAPIVLGASVILSVGITAVSLFTTTAGILAVYSLLDRIVYRKKEKKRKTLQSLLNFQELIRDFKDFVEDFKKSVRDNPSFGMKNLSDFDTKETIVNEIEEQDIDNILDHSGIKFSEVFEISKNKNVKI